MSAGLSLRAEGLSFTYRGSDRPALRDVHLHLQPGQLAYLMGPTGAGKSTLCLCLNGVIPAMQAGAFAGRVLVGDEDISGRPVHEVARKVGVLFQAFETQLLCSDLESEIAFGLENAQVPPEQIRARVDEMLALVGLQDLRDRDPADLSGGQKQRLALAAVLAPAPSVLVLDEPTTDLDPRGKRELMDVLTRLRAQGVTILIADHETEDALRADQLIVLSAGQVAYAGPPVELLRDPDRSRALGIRPLEIPELFARLGRPERPLTPQQAVALLPVPARAPTTDHAPPTPPPTDPAHHHTAAGAEVSSVRSHARPRLGADTLPPSEPIISVSEVTYRYPESGADALRGVSLCLYEGEFVALLGENGCGKTTLAKHLNGLLRPTSGSVTVAGMDTRFASAPDLAHQVGYLFQNPDHQIFADTVHAEVAFGPRNLGLAEDEVRDRVQQALALVGLEGYAQRDPFVLTKGERQRVALASILAQRPRVIVFDEPTTGLDGPQQERMMELLAELNRAGQTIVIITHCTWAAAGYARRALVMDDGRLVADLPVRELFGNDDLLARARQVRPPVAELSRLLAGPPLLTVAEVVAWLTAG